MRNLQVWTGNSSNHEESSLSVWIKGSHLRRTRLELDALDFEVSAVVFVRCASSLHFHAGHAPRHYVSEFFVYGRQICMSLR
jgi:hypothetical protein